MTEYEIVWPIIPRPCPLHASVPLQEPLLNFVPGSALAKSDFCAVIVAQSLFRLKKATYICPVIAETEVELRNLH